MKDFRYGYDFYDQSTMAIFDHSDYNKIYSQYTSPIKQLGSWIEGNQLRLNQLYEKVYSIENYHNFDIEKLSNLQSYNDLHHQIDNIESHDNQLRIKSNSLTKEFNDLVVRKYNDQTVPDWFNPVNYSVKNDLIVSSGLDIIGTQITGRSASRWLYFHIGESGQAATMDQQTLKAPIAAYAVSSIGSFTSVGDQIRFFGALPSTLRTVKIREIGLSTKLAGGFLLNRSVYPENDPLDHITTKTYPVATIVIYMTSDQAFSTKT